MIINFIKENPIPFIIAVTILFVADAIIMFFVARRYRANYNINAYNGGIVSLGTVIALFFSISFFIDKNLLGIPALIIAFLLESFVFVYNTKKIGKKPGIILSIVEMLLCVGSFFELAELSAFKRSTYSPYFKSNMPTKNNPTSSYYDKKSNLKK